MTTIRHHISDELLLGYSAGVLPGPFDLVVASHLSLNPAARDRLASFDVIGGEVLDRTDPDPVADVSLADTMQRIRAQADRRGDAATAPDGVFPSSLRAAVGGDRDAVAWRPVAMGIRQAILHTDEEASVRLLHIPAGQAMPQHSHAGTELTLVLCGAYSDEAGTFRRGDLDEADDDTDHSPVAEPGADCICLTATEAPLRFHRILPRLAQRFYKI